MLAAHRQYAKNLVQMRAMLEKARAQAPKKVRGYTVEQLEKDVARFERFVAMTDDEMRAHFASFAAR
jgi:hypothetical protein